MIPTIVHLLSGNSLRLFDFYSTKIFLSAFTALIVVLALGSPFIRLLARLQMRQQIRGEDYGKISELHQGKGATPTMGGLLIGGAMLTSLLLWMDLSSLFTKILALCTCFFLVVGFLDDFLKSRRKNSRGLSGRYKLLAQFIFSCLFSMALFFPIEGETERRPQIKESLIQKGEGGKKKVVEVSFDTFYRRWYLPFMKTPFTFVSRWWIPLFFLLHFFLIAAWSNAVNLTDGLDGLAAGSLTMVAAALSFFAFIVNNVALSAYLNLPYIEGAGEIAIYLAAFAGACLGFLWFNGHPAELFMGDTGSLTLGAVLGVSSILLKRECLVALMGILFVMEALSVILQVMSYRYRGRKRIFLCAPLHHHFELKGWPETKVVIRFWIISLIFVIIGFATLKFQ